MPINNAEEEESKQIKSERSALKPRRMLSYNLNFKPEDFLDGGKENSSQVNMNQLSNSSK
jgi:hypothetical protein